MLDEGLVWTARYYTSSSLDAARRFDEAALVAAALTEHNRSQEEPSRIRVEIAAVEAAVKAAANTTVKG